MGRLIAFVASGVLTLLDGGLGVWATLWPPASDAAKAHFLDGLILATVAAVAAICAFGVIEYRERNNDKREQAQSNRLIAELHAERFPVITEVTGTAKGTQAQQTITASATITVPSIAEEVKRGNVFVRFKRENVTSLRTAGLHLAKLYRDFAVRPDVTNSKYLTDFWNLFPFPEFSSIKDRIEEVVGFDVAPATEVLPSEPDRVKILARHLEKEALKVSKDVPLVMSDEPTIVKISIDRPDNMVTNIEGPCHDWVLDYDERTGTCEVSFTFHGYNFATVKTALRESIG